MKRHATTEELACLDGDALKPRKAARIHGHLVTCGQCQHVSKDIVGVSTLLETTSVQLSATMPDQYSVRIDAALRSQVTQRLSTEPATESGRRDLPRRSRVGRGWRLPGLSVPATRLVAAAGALIVIGGGGYAIASHVAADSGSTSTGSGSGSSAAIPHAAQAEPVAGPKVTYHSGGATRSIQAVRSDTNFVHDRLGAQAVVAVTEAREKGVVPMTSNARASASLPTTSTARGLASNGPVAVSSKLDGCVANVAGTRKVLLVELAKYQGRPATIIVLAPTAGRLAQVWVVSPSCSGSDIHALAKLPVDRT